MLMFFQICMIFFLLWNMEEKEDWEMSPFLFTYTVWTKSSVSLKISSFVCSTK